MSKISITKSSNHSKIIGNLGEQLVCNWLSRSGFEVAVVDHTGIDIIAFNPKSHHRMGITVKSRTRNKDKETSTVNLFRQNKKKPDREKVVKACQAFGCEPWIGVYVETTDYADLFLTSLKNFEKKHLKNPDKKLITWQMKPKNMEAYAKDDEVLHLHSSFECEKWFNSETMENTS
jgi:hypothetical protein